MKALGHLIIFLTLVVAIHGWSGTAGAEGVVLSSTAPGMTVGRVIADDETLRLPDDTLTTLLLPSGQILKLNGPYEGKAVAAAPAGSTKTTALGDWQGLDVSSLGGTRGDLLADARLPAAASPLTVDASVAGTWCVGPETALHLARPADRTHTTLLLEDTASGARATVSWTDDAEQPWPASLPVRDGTTLLARWGEGAVAHPVRFRMIEEGDRSGSAVLRVMHWALAGCYRQAAPYLRALGNQVAPFDLYLSTDRGRTPRYAIGEPVTLILQTNRPARLYCFVSQHGSVVPLFTVPPGYLAIADHSELRIPGERVAVEIAAAPPPGLGEVRCYALDLAVIDNAAPIIGPDLIETGSEDRLERVFAALPEGRVARAHLSLRID